MRLCLGSSDPSKSTGMLYLPPHYKPLGSYIETVANEEQKNVGWVESSSDFGIVPRFGDFSSGEGGFELFDHQHRYNGQDGMISLGGGSSASTSPSSATSQTNPSADEVVPHSHIRVPTLPTSTKMASDPSAMLSYYNSLSSCISARIDSVLLDLSFYYARRIILLVLCAPPPSLQPLTLSSLSAPGVTPSRAASDLLAVVSSCVSSEVTGWMGEAGSMALAAEALGLRCRGFDKSGGERLPKSSSLTGFAVTRRGGGEATMAQQAEIGLAAGGSAALAFLKKGMLQVSDSILRLTR